jgi:hypothetical protein
MRFRQNICRWPVFSINVLVMPDNSGYCLNQRTFKLLYISKYAGRCSADGVIVCAAGQLLRKVVEWKIYTGK